MIIRWQVDPLKQASKKSSSVFGGEMLYSTIDALIYMERIQIQGFCHSGEEYFLFVNTLVLILISCN